MATSIIGNNNLKVDLLWTNSSPTSAFEGQELSNIASGYRAIVVVFNNESTDTTKSSKLVVGNDTVAQTITSSSGIAYRRNINFASNGNVSFGTGTKWTSYNTSGTNDISVLIPFKIYGLK